MKMKILFNGKISRESQNLTQIAIENIFKSFMLRVSFKLRSFYNFITTQIYWMSIVFGSWNDILSWFFFSLLFWFLHPIWFHPQSCLNPPRTMNDTASEWILDLLKKFITKCECDVVFFVFFCCCFCFLLVFSEISDFVSFSLSHPFYRNFWSLSLIQFFPLI
jgi:hypothetical protein